MKRAMGMGLAALLTSVTIGAQAAPNAADWQLVVQVNDRLEAKATLTGKPGAAQEYRHCRTNQGSTVVSLSVEQDDGFVASTTSGSNPSHIRFLDDASSRKSVQCTTEPDAATAQRWDNISVVVKAPTEKNIQAQLIVSPDEYTADLYSWEQAALDKLGELKSCKAFTSTIPIKGEKEIGTCTPSLKTNQLTVTLTEKISRGRVEIKFGENDANTVVIGVAACQFRVTGPIPVLVAGAVSQQISLKAANGDTQTACSLNAQTVNQIMLGETSLPVKPLGSFKDSTEASFLMENIPATLSQGTQEFKIVGDRGTIGIGKLEVVPPIVAGKKITVAYDLSKIGDPLSERYRSFFEGATVNDDAIAVENPLSADRWKRFVITNTVDLTISPKIPIAQIPSWAGLDPTKTTNPGLGVEYTVEDSELVWAVRTGSDNVWFPYVTNVYQSGSTVASSIYQVLHARPERITFDAPKGAATPIRRKIALLKVVRYRSHPGGVLLTNKVEPVLEAEVTLAEKTRRESVPLPIHDLLQVSCVEDVTWVGQSYSVASDDLKVNACKLIFRDAKTSATSSVLPPQEILELFGPQQLIVKIKGEGARVEEEVWQPDTNYANTQVPLNTHVTDSAITGVYEVNAKIAAGVQSKVTYRVGSKDNEANVAINGDPRFTFKALLRPRNAADFCCKARLYMTAFLPVTGLRLFGTAPTELRSSQDYTNFQVVEPKLGLLMGAEPYSHALGKNNIPLQPSVQAGMNLVSLAHGGFVPTFLIGGAATIPVLEEATAKLGSKLTLGVYYEYDPRVANRYAHHMLLTLGLNVGALLSASPR